MTYQALRVAFVVGAIVAASACSLSPQPLPPGDTASRTPDGGFGGNNGEPSNDAGAPASDGDGGLKASDASADGSPLPPPIDAGDGGDAGDAGTDAPSDGPTDAPTDGG